ncbi:hypothetical protein CUW27_20810 [Salmonella enterica]|nr:hypothetical protein [Salmonella enterica]
MPRTKPATPATPATESKAATPRNVRFSADQLARIDAECKRLSKATGFKVSLSDVIRRLVDEHLK